MIRVEIYYWETADIPNMRDSHSHNIWLCGKLEDAGIPIVGGPLLPKVDLSKVMIEKWDNFIEGKMTFTWHPNGGTP